MTSADFRRVIVVGSSGSGKSHFSKRLAAITGLPLIHLDNEFWQPNWVKTPRPEWIAKQERMIKEDRWIIDGNYDSTMELRFTAADLVIFLDINRCVCIASAVARHGKKRSDLPEYLEEKFGGDFFDFLKWIWDFGKKGKQTILQLHDKYPEKDFLVLKSRRAAKKYLSGL